MTPTHDPRWPDDSRRRTSAGGRSCRPMLRNHLIASVADSPLLPMCLGRPQQHREAPISVRSSTSQHCPLVVLPAVYAVALSPKLPRALFTTEGSIERWIFAVAVEPPARSTIVEFREASLTENECTAHEKALKK